MKITLKHVSIIAIAAIVFFGHSVAAAAPSTAAVRVDVYVDNGGNSGAPRAASDFRLGVARTGDAPRFVFGGSEQGTVVPLVADDRSATDISISLVDTVPSYVPVYEGDCYRDGTLEVFAGEFKVCRVTMTYLSFNEGGSMPTIVKVIKRIDNTGTGGDVPPRPEDFTLTLTRPNGFTATFQGSATGINIGIASPSYEVREVPNSAFPNFVPTYTDDCSAIGSGQMRTCVVTNSFLNKSNGNPPNSVLKIVTTIESFDPDRRNLPQVSDFPTTVLDASGQTVARLAGSETGSNLGVRAQPGRTVTFDLSVERNAQLSKYIPVVSCDGNYPQARIDGERMTLCEVRLYFVSISDGDSPIGVLRIGKSMVNAGRPGETSDPQNFEIQISRRTGGFTQTVRDTGNGVFVGISNIRSYEITELPNRAFPDYLPIFGNGCTGEGLIRFNDCEITNYSIYAAQPESNSVVRVVTTIDSTGDPSPVVPQPGDFVTTVFRQSTPIHSGPGSEIGTNFGVDLRSNGNEIRVEVARDARFPNYFATYGPDCRRDDVQPGRAVTCEIRMVYVGGTTGENASSVFRIIKRLENTVATDRPKRESDFTLGVYDGLQLIASVPGSAAGVTVGFEPGPVVVREITPPTDYVPVYNSGCNPNFSVIPDGELKICTVTNVYVGGTPPRANGQSVTVEEDKTVGIALSATDPDNAALNYLIVSPPAHGTLSGVAPNLTYTPVPNYNGPDSFVFRARDPQFDSNDATVTINVTPINDAPVATGRTVSLITGSATQIQLFATDVEGDPLTASVVSGPINGGLTINGLIATYTPASGFVGQDAFTFRVSDGTAFSGTATVTITVANGIVVGNVSKLETNSGINRFQFNVELLAPTVSNVSVNYSTANGTALAGSDYTANSGTVTFVRGGPRSVPVTVDVLGDQLFETNETFRLNLSNPVGAALKNLFATGTILNDDPQVGIASMSPSAVSATVGERFTIDLTWIHPERWRLLDEIEFRIVDDEGTAMWVKFEENGTELPFRQFNVNSRKYGDPYLPGADVVFDTNLAKMFVADSVVVGSGPTGPSATVRPSLSFKPRAAGRTFRVELLVRDDFGNVQGFDPVGTISVAR